MRRGFGIQPGSCHICLYPFFHYIVDVVHNGLPNLFNGLWRTETWHFTCEMSEAVLDTRIVPAVASARYGLRKSHIGYRSDISRICKMEALVAMEDGSFS